MRVFLIKDGVSKPIVLSPSQKIGSGGMGSVWKIGNVFGQGNLVAKIYHRPDEAKTPTEEKLWAMIHRTPDSIQEIIDGVKYTQFAWPQYVVKDDHQRFIGFAMPELDFSRSISLNPFMYPREAEKKLTDYQNSLNNRVQLGANISALMADLHRHGHAFIDFKEQNLRLMPQAPNGHEDEYKGFIVGFIDCDSFLITDARGNRYPCSVISPEMTSPEYHQHQDISQLDEKHDRFVLAIELFKILNYGIHPFYFIPKSERLKNQASRITDDFIKQRLYAYAIAPNPEIAPLKQSIHECWDDKTREMFDKAFLSENPDDRPTAQQWTDHLRSILDNRQFERCVNFPNDVGHMHFIGKACHRCLLDSLSNEMPSSSMPNLSVDNINADTLQRNYSPYNSVANNQQENSSLNSWQTFVNDGANNEIPTQETYQQVSAHNLADRLRQEQGLSADIVGQQQATPFVRPVRPTTRSANSVNTSTVTHSVNGSTHHQYTNQSHNQIRGNYPEATVNQNISNNPNITGVTQNQPSSNNKKWLIPIIVIIMLCLGYAFSKILSGLDSQNQESDNIATATASDTTGKQSKTTDSYQKILQNLPEATSNIIAELGRVDRQGGAGKGLTAKSAGNLYQDTLGIPTAFFSEVLSVAEVAESDLVKMQNIANQKDEERTQQFAQQAFRSADLEYFRKMPTDKTLAKKLNEEARRQYWEKRNPKAALYLQAKSVLNYPLHGEYMANLAFYLFKNNYPYSREFILFALQAPRSNNKYPNTFMIELIAASEVKNGNELGAVGALLTQFYTAEDRDQRCMNMLKYPKNYPQLVASAEEVFAIIEQQYSEGIYIAPAECLPPYEWVN